MAEAGPVNVLILVDKFDYHGSHLNGPARYYSWLVERLDRRRFNPVLCALRARGRSDVLFRERGLEVLYLALGRWDPRGLSTIVRLIRQCEIDVLHLTGYGATAFGRMAGLLTRTPVIVHEHWVDPGLSRLHAAVERGLAILPARAIAVSEYAREFLIDKKGIPPDRISVIRNGIPLEQFRDAPPDDGSARRTELGIPADSLVVGIVGMLHENKGHRYFLDALAREELRRPELVGVIVGDGEMRAELEALATRLGVDGRVRFLGHRMDMPAILKMFDVWVSASLSETAPLGLLEAMAAGRAIVATNCGGPGEIIRHRKNGLLVPVSDTDALAGAIAELAQDEGLREQLGGQAQADSGEYDIRDMVRAIEELYVQVAGRAFTTGVTTRGKIK